ncbi:uncharacterized protein LOC112517718 [Cynara cardunculus var. scolymus]|uniref:uncharacterized protein LOC112517718 n=1 Tax=Cynara cardunculus var. scolymus TaxID=59895 RepID=UPI000D62F34F|nr:uncharacterized protein LOC112517718 [Cynara cardunculus var. scolymus]
MPRSQRREFFEFDPDIERTFHHRRRAKRAIFALLPPNMALPPPIIPEIPHLENQPPGFEQIPQFPNFQQGHPHNDFPLLFPEDALKKSKETDVLETPKLDDKISSEPPKGTTKAQGIQDPSCSTPPSKNVIKLVPPYVPYPQRLRNKKEELHFNIPLVEAIEQMPSYAKFLKDILSKKKKLTEYVTVALTEGCSALLTNSITPKLKDLGSFTIPCSIGGKKIGKALCIGEARPTTVTLQLANKSIAYPKRKIEDVLVQVDKFIFPADFIILDFEADKDIPIILGRPFLATERTLIDVQKGELTKRLQDQKVTFNVFNSLKYPHYLEECSRISEIEEMCLEEGIQKNLKLEGEYDEEIEEESVEEIEELGTDVVLVDTATFELLENNEQKDFTPSIESPPDLELKQLPSHLKYQMLQHWCSVDLIHAQLFGGLNG